jgi:hypothetical protein
MANPSSPALPRERRSGRFGKAHLEPPLDFLSLPTPRELSLITRHEGRTPLALSIPRLCSLADLSASGGLAHLWGDRPLRDITWQLQVGAGGAAGIP